MTGSASALNGVAVCLMLGRSRRRRMIDYIITDKFPYCNRQYDDKQEYFTGLIVQNIELG